MANTLAQPIPQRTYIFVANKAAVGDQVNKELDTLYSTLQGGLGDAHIASNAAISGSKIAPGSIPTSALASSDLQSGFALVPIGAVLDFWSDGTVPAGYQLCDGQNITDSASPLSGKATPNLVNVFVKYVASANLRAASVTGGNSTHTHSISADGTHSHGAATGAAGNHSHSGGTDSQGYHQHSFTTDMGHYSSGGSSNVYTQSAAFGTPAHYHQGNVDGNGNHTHNLNINGVGDHQHGIGNDGNHSHGGGTGGASSEPPWVGLVKIMRIK